MAHFEQQEFFRKIKSTYPDRFKGKKVADFGSLDVNGSLKSFFDNCEYTGIDIVEGKNVDIVSKAHEFMKDEEEVFDVIVSGEMLEHDEYWQKSLVRMYKLCKHGGLIAISCAGKDRPEHGTRKSDGNEWGTGDYYMNIEPDHIKQVYKNSMFMDMHFEENSSSKDTYFYGIKR